MPYLHPMICKFPGLTKLQQIICMEKKILVQVEGHIAGLYQCYLLWCLEASMNSTLLMDQSILSFLTAVNPVLNKQMVTNQGMYTLNNSLLIICMCTTLHTHNKPLFCHVCLCFERCLISRVLQDYVVPSESDLLSDRFWRAVVGPSRVIFFKPLSD